MTPDSDTPVHEGTVYHEGNQIIVRGQRVQLADVTTEDMECHASHTRHWIVQRMPQRLHAVLVGEMVQCMHAVIADARILMCDPLKERVHE
jgi:hypothetical protein